MLGNPMVGTVYRVGAGGVRVLHRDGSVSQHAAFSLLTFARTPQRIEGRLYPVTNQATRLSYEAPALDCETKR